MKNMKMTVKGDVLTITVDLTGECGMSQSGKTMKVATSGGNLDVPEHAGYKLGLNVYKYPETK